MEVPNIAAGIEAARTAPVGIGIQTLSVAGFRIRLASNKDADDTFHLEVRALFAPEADGATMTWRDLSADQVILCLSAAISFSERHFGSVAVDGADDVIEAAESFLTD